MAPESKERKEGKSNYVGENAESWRNRYEIKNANKKSGAAGKKEN